jgi:peptidoglycan/xylan/chitin deacetylase (PgdA/CDA1 family)
MRLAVFDTARRTGEWFRRKLTSGGIILLYHRVAALTSDPQLLAVKPKHFADHLEIVKKNCSPVSLKEFVGGFQEKTRPRRPVAITFDDGYVDNLANAKPLLERYAVPATIFVTAGYVGSGREFWWDDLERLILEPAELPKTLDLCDVNGPAFKWEFGTGNVYDPDAYRSWNVQFSEDPTPRHALYRSLCELLRPLPEGNQRSVLDRLQNWAGKDDAGRSTHLPLTSEELARLDQGGLVEVGAHTCTHALLSSLSKSKQQAEIQGSKIVLEKILGHPVVSFAYPFGARSDYNADSVQAVCQAGFERACANYPGTVWRRSDCFQLPRLLVRDWDGETFERWLGGWVDG